LEQLSAALPEQQEDFLSPSLADLDEQHDACDLLQVAFAVSPDFALSEQDFASDLLAALAADFFEFPPRATFLVEASAADLLEATCEVVDLLEVEASD